MAVHKYSLRCSKLCTPLRGEQQATQEIVAKNAKVLLYESTAMDYNELIRLWEYTMRMLYKNDRALFEAKVQERAIAGRLAIYLQHKYDSDFKKKACIDIEYNREGELPKRPHPRDDGGWIAPDILLHIRKESTNIFYCEVKKHSSENNDDSTRVKDALEERKYQYGLNLYSVKSDEARISVYTHDNNCIRQTEYIYSKYLRVLNETGTVRYWTKKCAQWIQIENENGWEQDLQS